MMLVDTDVLICHPPAGLPERHGLQMGDALIAATALEHQLPVLTANVKHFGAVAGLTVEAFVP
jgi:predicted nucleic acid-binding protein